LSSAQLPTGVPQDQAGNRSNSQFLIRDRTKITWHKLPAKVPKRPDILLTECQDNVFPFPSMGKHLSNF